MDDGTQPLKGCGIHYMGEKCLCKKQRVVNKTLCKSYQGKHCLLCMRTSGTVGHHYKSKGSGGHDMHFNLMPLCPEHHNEYHNTDEAFMIKKYGKVILKWLHRNGWIKRYDGKYWHTWNT